MSQCEFHTRFLVAQVCTREATVEYDKLLLCPEHLDAAQRYNAREAAARDRKSSAQEIKERAAADAKRLSTLDRMAGNIAAGLVMVSDVEDYRLNSSVYLEGVARDAAKLARLIYEENRK